MEHTEKNPNAMTEAQALAEAQRRWGNYAYVFDRESAMFHFDHSKMLGRFYVGNPALGNQFPYGNGHTWEEAFEDVAKH